MGKTEEQTISWQERRKDIKHNWLTPFIYLEWLCERFSFRLRRWALIEIFGHASIIIGLFFYMMEADERLMQAENQRKAKHYQAWQVINAAHGKRGGRGRIYALQDLNKDGISLVGIDVSKAYLPAIDLEDASLNDANFSGAYLRGADFSEADLHGADFSGSDLSDADLSGAYLRGADFSEAKLPGADLAGANLFNADLSGASLYKANLSGTNLGEADLSGVNLMLADLSGSNMNYADLSEANLKNANLSGTFLVGANLYRAFLLSVDFSGAYLGETDLLNIRNWDEIKSMKLAKIYNVNNPPEGFIEWANKHGAVMISSSDEWEAMMRSKWGRKKVKRMP